MDYETVAGWTGILRLLLFVGLFVGILVWVFRPGARKSYDEQAQIPLREEETPHGPEKDKA